MGMNETSAPDDVRTLFSTAMSEMYRAEVPQYGTLLKLVADVNDETRRANPELERRLLQNEEIARLNLERHGAIRLGTARELAMMRRLFAVMGMFPVGYYDLSVAGVPVHATAFRPVTGEGLRRNPFRVFTSLLRLELIDDASLRAEAAAILERRSIFTGECIALIETAERSGGLTREEAGRFVQEALETFRWHRRATVPADVYHRLRASHPLVADVVCFRGPHINHLTPRTLDIDAAQAGMPERGITAKAVVEGPPPRKIPILLRQTSFKALQEPVAFLSETGGAVEDGTHTARFGEIEQRGVALTPEGRALYDELLAAARSDVRVSADGGNAEAYMAALIERFAAFPDDEDTLRRRKLAFFRYRPVGDAAVGQGLGLEDLLRQGAAVAEPITYEDFLPVSAAGIFQSNLGDEAQTNGAARSSRSSFEAALGAPIANEIDIYRSFQDESIALCLRGSH
jgi:uncharacterized glyoxalase superfamily metalloenzyme YdcJ